ncbi:MAG: tetratricopeptide repeat protein [Deltaproteobacteria bacterium]|nr:tetratricopeptide repeat protein [Deltaproteobacteria bacterium]
MSYIHEALQKAQKAKDARFPKYKRILLGSKGKPGIFFSRTVWLISLFVILLAFTFYSWFDFKYKKTLPAPKNQQAVVSHKIEATVNFGEFYERAKKFQKIGRLKEAQGFYKQALTLEPDNVFVLNNLGVIYIQQRKYSEASNNLESAIRIKPEYVDPYYNLACLYALKGKVMKSLENLKKAISLNKLVREWARKDRDLQNMKGVPEFEEIIKKK